MISRKTERPRGLLKGISADPYRHRYMRYHASPDLALYIEHFWLVEWDLRGKDAEPVQTLPHPSVHMIFESEGRSRVAGPSRAKFSRVIQGKGGVFAAKFTPGGFRPFARTAMSSLADRTVPLRAIFGTDGDHLERAILAESTDESRVALVEEFLRKRRPEPDENVELASKIVYDAAGDRTILRVEQIAERYAMTTRTLQRLLAAYVGVSPKSVIQRYRLHEAAEQLAADESRSHAELAIELGYSDQAHFVRDFKAIVGMSPAAYTKAARRAGSGASAKSKFPA